MSFVPTEQKTPTLGFHDEVKSKILTELAMSPLTTRQLETRCNISYPSVRRAIGALLEDNQIIRFDFKARNTRYTIAPVQARTSFVPSVTFNGHTVKLTEMYNGQGLEELTNDVATSILKAWTDIAMVAKRLSEGLPSTVVLKRLNRDKVLLASARTTLEQLNFLVVQLLNNENLWDAHELVNFTDDPDWPNFAPILDAMHEHFYGTEKKEEGREGLRGGASDTDAV